MTPHRPNFRAGFRCSTAARLRDDPRVGTAPPARLWFLIEQDGGWGPTAWDGLAVDPDTKHRLAEIVGQAGARMMLIRRHAGRPETRPRRWCIVNQDAAQPVRWGTAASDEELVEAALSLSRSDLADQAVVDPPLLILVCTHGLKDVCCAVRGRPVAAKLAQLWPEATWECTHTGGDRFAGNLILLPDGACYGGLDPHQVEALVRDHIAGAVQPAALRGPTGWPTSVQAAVVEAHRRFGPMAWHDVTVISQQSGAGEHWQVRLHVAGHGHLIVRGHIEVSEPHQLTCKGAGPKVMRLPVVDTMDEAGAED